jgi:hypothetical protein
MFGGKLRAELKVMRIITVKQRRTGTVQLFSNVKRHKMMVLCKYFYDHTNDFFLLGP